MFAFSMEQFTLSFEIFYKVILFSMLTFSHLFPFYVVYSGVPVCPRSMIYDLVLFLSSLTVDLQVCFVLNMHRMGAFLVYLNIFVHHIASITFPTFLLFCPIHPGLDSFLSH